MVQARRDPFVGHSPLWPHSPLWRRRFFRGAINGMLFQHAHRFRHRALKLRIASGNHIFGPVLDVDVRRDAFVLYGPSIVARKEATARSDHRSTIDERRRVRGMDEPAPGSLADEQSYLSIPEHVRHKVAARAGHLVYDHHLRSPDSAGRTGEW